MGEVNPQRGCAPAGGDTGSSVWLVPNRWMDGVPDAPGGLVGAWINVLVGAAFVVGLPIIVFNQAQAPANVLFAIAALALAGFLEATFIHKLRQQLARRRYRQGGEDVDSAHSDAPAGLRPRDKE